MSSLDTSSIDPQLAFNQFVDECIDITEYKPIQDLSNNNHWIASFAQKRNYVLSELHNDQSSQYQSLIIDIKEEVQADRLELAWSKLLERHEILRTTVGIVGSEVKQTILSKVDSKLEFHQIEPSSWENTIDGFISSFSSSTPTLLKATVIKSHTDNSVLIVCLSHNVLDAYSKEILVNDLYHLYHGKPLTETSFRYKDYARWQYNNFVSPKHEGHRSFWREEFDGQNNALELPADLRKGFNGRSQVSSLTFHIDPHESAFLRALAVENNVKLFTVILSLFSVFLGKLSNQNDFVIGMPVSGRVLKAWKNVAGDMINVLPIKITLNKNYSIKQLLAKLNAKLKDCIAHGPHAHGVLLDNLRLEANSGSKVMLGAVFSAYDTKSNSQTDIPWLLRKSSDESYSFMHDIGLSLLKSEGDIELRFDISNDLFSDTTIQRFVNYFKNIVGSVVEENDLPIREIAIISEAEKIKLLQQFNDTHKPINEKETIISLFDDQVNLTPKSLALQYGDEKISYTELNELVEKQTKLLERNGVVKGTLVMLLLDRSVEYVVNMLAILKKNAVYMPVDLDNPDQRINFIIEDSGTEFIVAKKKSLVGRKINLPSHQIYIDDVQVENGSGTTKNSNTKFAADDFYVAYTSGSTGRPKGVIGSHNGLLNRLNWGWNTHPYQKEEKCCQKTSVSFIDHITEILSPLLKGIPLIIIDSRVTDVNLFLDTLNNEKITRLTVVPSLLKEILRVKRMMRQNRSSLKYVFCSGDILTNNLADSFYKEFSSCKLFNIYGSTEVSADVSSYYVNRFDVREILKYFTNLSEELPVDDELKSMLPEDLFTVPDTSLSDLAGKFRDSRLSVQPMPLDQYYEFFGSQVMPYTINTASPRFIGHMTSVLPDYVHDLSKLISQMNQNLVKIETSKSVTFMEREAIAVLHRLFYALPNQFYEEHIQKLNSNMGIITSGGTIANISALLSARNKGLYKTLEKRASSGSSIHALLQEQGYKDMVFIGTRLMHYSFKKALSILGLGVDNMMFVQNDEQGTMILSDLQQKIDYCKREKLFVIAIVGIAGSTERGSIDPLPELADIASRNKIHFHVDAAWGGALMFSAKYKHLLKGVERADSITFCGHKQLFLPQGISVCLFKDPGYLSFNATTAAYQAQPNSYDFGRFTIEGSRPALSICLHASLRILGLQGFGMLVENGIENAKVFAKMINEVQGLELLSRHMNIINYRYIPINLRGKLSTDKLSQDDVNEINRVNVDIQQHQFYQGETFVSKTTIQDNHDRDIIVFRVVLSNPLTTHEDLVDVLKDQIEIIEEMYDETNHLHDFEHVVSETSVKTLHQDYGVLIGKPISNTKVLILNDDNQLQPVGVQGDIYVSGQGLTRGYLNNEGLNKKHIRTNPYFKDELMYRTGDIGKWTSDGNIEFIGRKDNQVKIGGHRIELAEIESALMNIVNVKEAVVLTNNRHEDRKLVAFVVPENEFDSKSAKAALSRQLPGYMIPQAIISLEAMPLSVGGKIDRGMLLDKWTNNLVMMESHREPETDIQKQICEIWTQLLGVSKIGLDDTFFDLGGHSILLIVTLKQVNQHFEVDLPLDLCFSMTLEQMAHEIHDRRESLLSIGRTK